MKVFRRGYVLLYKGIPGYKDVIYEAVFFAVFTILHSMFLHTVCRSSHSSDYVCNDQ